MSSTTNAHRYEIWWVDRAKSPDVQLQGDHVFGDYHQAQLELLNNDVPVSGHFVIKRFDLNSPVGEVVHVDHRPAKMPS